MIAGRCFLFALFALVATSARGQDLYDPLVLRTFNITFVQSNWEQLLRANYVSETDLAGTVEVDGVVYPNVGIRIRGNTSFTGLPTGSQKFSLKLEMDFADPNQNLMGFNTINLNNGWRDPTFTREVEFNNYLAQFVPNARANSALVTINGQNWGVYNNVQQTNKGLLRRYFGNPDGLRVLCANNPNGPGLSFSPTLNASYEIQDTGGLSLQQATADFIALTNTISNAPLNMPGVDVPNMDRAIAIDPSIWTVVLENLLTDDDSYINKGCDFLTYRDPLDLRTHILQRDANETWTMSTWSITRNFAQTNKPFLSRVLAVPELRQRYLAHYRVAKQDLSWATLQTRFAARRALLQSHVEADPKRIYTLDNFNNGFGTTPITLTNRITNTPATGLAGGSIPGVQQFVDARAAFLANATSNPELAASGPGISAVNASNSTPSPTTPVFISAAVAPATAAIARVELFYRPNPSDIYARIDMLDDGLSGDGAAGDGVYGVRLPITAVAGQIVHYYVMATAADSVSSLSFSPPLAERGPRTIAYGLGGTVSMQLTEWMYSGRHGEFVEFSNRSGSPIDMSNWVLKDDQLALPGLNLSALGTVQPGEAVIITDAVASAFRAAWNLPETAKVIGELGSVMVGGANYGRADQIHLFDSAGVLVDRLFYGDETFVGSIRTQNVSGQAPCSALGQNNVLAWVLASDGDVYGSLQSEPNVSNQRDIGSPGRFNAALCSAGALIFADGFEP
ncbi:MAG: CotH kinase family protein [Pseudomarimonas sp.]